MVRLRGIIPLQIFKDCLPQIMLGQILEYFSFFTIVAYLRRGISYQSLGNLEKALKDFTKVVELEPKNKRGKVK